MPKKTHPDKELPPAISPKSTSTYHSQPTPHPSQTALLASSLSLSTLPPSSLSLSLLFLSFSLVALSYALPSSVPFGAFTPNAPAIILPAAALLFSGLLSPSCDLVLGNDVGERGLAE